MMSEEPQESSFDHVMFSDGLFSRLGLYVTILYSVNNVVAQFYPIYISPKGGYHLIMVGQFACLNDPYSYMYVG